MLQNRRLASDLVALGLLGLVIFLGLSLGSYDPADPLLEFAAPFDRLYRPDVSVYPVSTTVGNACGVWGAVVADVLLTALGWGAYYLVLSLAVLDIQLLRRRDIDTPIIRLFGWLVSLIGMTAIVGTVAPGLSPGPVIGSGGYLGALGSGLLQAHFATAGSLILAASLVAGGLLLCTDYVLLRMAFSLVKFLVIGATRSVSWRPQEPVDDEDDDIEARLAALAAQEAAAAEAETEEAPARVKSRRRKRNDLDGRRPKAEGAVQAATAPEALGDEFDDAEELPAVPVKRRRGRRKVERVEEEAVEEESAVEEPAGKPRGRRRSEQAARLEVMHRLDEASRVDDTGPYDLPDLDLLIPEEDFEFEEQELEVRRKARILEKTFASFGFKVRVVEIETGPVIAQYEVELEAGLRLSRITGLADDLAIALRVPSVRIVAPIPGKNTVGIEVPNETRQIVRLREVMEQSDGRVRKMRIPLFLGKDVSGNPLVIDLSTLPHLLIAGRTGTGKSVCLNAIIASMLMTRRPDEVRMLMIDPKMVELSGYGRLPHLMHPVVTDMRKAEAILAWAVEKMEERYSLLARAGVRHISSYNQLDEDELLARLEPETDEEAESIPRHLPFIVIVADEIADLMMTSGKEVEQHIIRLAQKSRAVGIHLILATQKPTVDVITGLIKSNLPARISFQVASRTDSRVVLDEMGAEKLLGNGDLLFLWPGTSTLLRGQGTYLDDSEIEQVVDFVSRGEQRFVEELINIQVDDPGDLLPGNLKKRDELYEAAVDVVVREGRGSVSLLQRTMGIGYGRAARLIDYMAEDGIVGPYAGSQAREVLLSLEQWQQMQGTGTDGPSAPPEPPVRRSRKLKLRQPARRTIGAEEADVDEENEEDVLRFVEDDEDSDDFSDFEDDDEDPFVTRFR